MPSTGSLAIGTFLAYWMWKMVETFRFSHGLHFGELQKRTTIAYLMTSAMLYRGRYRPHLQTSFHIEGRFT